MTGRRTILNGPATSPAACPNAPAAGRISEKSEFRVMNYEDGSRSDSNFILHPSALILFTVTAHA